MKPADAKTRPKTRAKAPRTLAELGERPFLRELRAQTQADSGSSGSAQALALGIGDDAAVLRGAELTRGLVVTADALIEGVHFRREWISPADLGRKALAVNLSDLAAMGARPLAAFLTLSVPGATPLVDLRAFFRGLRAAGKAWGCPLAGGDLTGSERWVLSITALGTPAVGKRVLRRDAARPGDYVYVTGWPGESAAGLEALRHGLKLPALIRSHHRPTPRLAEAALLATLPRVALLDISDGVFNDASQLAEASGVAIHLNEQNALPLSKRLQRFAEAVRTENSGEQKNQAFRGAIDYFLYGGEDFELLFATPSEPGKLIRQWKVDKLVTPLHCIGRIVQGEGVWLNGIRLESGAKDLTYRHFG